MNFVIFQFKFCGFHIIGQIVCFFIAQKKSDLNIVIYISKTKTGTSVPQEVRIFIRGSIVLI